MDDPLRARFAGLLGEPDPDPAELAVLIAARARPGMDVAAQLARVQVLAESALALGGTADAVVVTLRAHGPRGERPPAASVRGLLLPDVLDRGRGAAITLAVLTLAVARRAGVAMTAAEGPEHPLVVAGDPATGRWFDPFHGWASLPGGVVHTIPPVPAPGEQRGAIGIRMVMKTMLLHARAVYLRDRALRDALWATDFAMAADPADRSLRRGMSVLLAGVGRYDDAETAAEAYLADDPGAADAAEVAHHLAAVREMQQRMN